MNKYTVHLTTVASVAVHVEAEDLDSAIDEACNEVYVQLCHQCSREIDLSDVWEPESVFSETGERLWQDNDQ